MIRCVPRKTFVKPHRATALTTSATIGSARISRSIAATTGLRARGAGGPRRLADERRGRIAASDRSTRRRRASAPAVEGRWRRWMRVDGFVAEGDVEGLGLVRVRADERREGAGARVAFAAAPDRVHVGGDRHQLGEVARRDRRRSSPNRAGACDRARDRDRRGWRSARSGSAGCGRNSMRGLTARFSSRLPRMSSPIGRRTSRRGSSSPGRMAASTVSVRGITFALDGRFGGPVYTCSTRL